MIISPNNWNEIGKPIEIKDIELTIKQIVNDLPCNCLAFSGGLDSTLMLYFMLQKFEEVQTFTIGVSENHPDIKYAKLVIKKFSRTEHLIYIPTQKEIDDEVVLDEDVIGDRATRLFYKFVGKYTDEIVSCDGIDEYMCGYYAHQNLEPEITYYEYLRMLQISQLKPLNRNSGKVNVYLPYLDAGLISLLSQIPTFEKVTGKERKVLMIKMARGKIPNEIINRRKYGFCDVLKIKK